MIPLVHGARWVIWEISFVRPAYFLLVAFMMLCLGCSESGDSGRLKMSSDESNMLVASIGRGLYNDILIFKMMDGEHEMSESVRYLMARSIMVGILIMDENDLGPASQNWGVDALSGLCYINEHLNEIGKYVHHTELDYARRYIDTVIDGVHERLQSRRAVVSGAASMCGFSIEKVIDDLTKRSRRD